MISSLIKVFFEMFRFRALFNRTQFVNFFSRKTSLEYKKAQDEKISP